MPKMYKDDFTNERRLAWVRHNSQCRYRDEVCTLTFSEFCQFWHSTELWDKRGRAPDDLVLTRFDHTLPWNRDNCCIITRYRQLNIRNKRRYELPYLHLYEDAIVYGK
jgi:hypothetical protein